MGGGKRLFRFFYQTTSLKTFATLRNLDYFMNAFQIKSMKCSGRELSKMCITGLVVANAVGDKLPIFVTGKAKKPRCFKNVKFLTCCYGNQRKSWMDGVLFEKWPRKMDKNFVSEGRKVALVINNRPVHSQIDNLKLTNLFFFSQ